MSKMYHSVLQKLYNSFSKRSGKIQIYPSYLIKAYRNYMPNDESKVYLLEESLPEVPAESLVSKPIN